VIGASLIAAISDIFHRRILNALTFPLVAGSHRGVARLKQSVVVLLCVAVAGGLGAEEALM
jgi:hypothetical protein